jgi:pyrimidine deaminase RibD-like protein
MLMALWMEIYPRPTPLTSQNVRPTGCILVDSRDRVVALERTGEAHAVVRAILGSAVDVRGCEVYVSRFPCATCTKVMAANSDDGTGGYKADILLPSGTVGDELG